MLVDIHAHLDFFEFGPDIEEVIRRAKDAGVKAIINNGVDNKSNRKTLELSKKYHMIKPALGLYPVHCAEITEQEFSKELEFISKQKPIAIGEVGLDYYRGDDNPFGDEKRKIMKRCFEEFIRLSEKKKLPIIVHSRKAEQDCIDMLESSSNKKIIMHCFSGNHKLVKQIRKNGWMFSIPCNILRSHHFQKIVEETGINQLLTETDAPYLSPYPGKRNEPAFIKETIKKIAELKKFDEKEVKNNIFLNYQKTFL